MWAIPARLSPHPRQASDLDGADQLLPGVVADIAQGIRGMMPIVIEHLQAQRKRRLMIRLNIIAKELTRA